MPGSSWSTSPAPSQVAGHSVVSEAANPSGGSHYAASRGVRVIDFEEPSIRWRKSTASNSGGCLEVAVADGSLLVRDSKNRNGVVLRLSPAVWSSFLERARITDVNPRQA